MRRDETFALIVVLIFALAACYGVVKAVEYEEGENLRMVLEKERETNVLDNAHDINEQYVETTFHNYLVISYKEKVVNNGVIHLANCKCKK